MKKLGQFLIGLMSFFLFLYLLGLLSQQHPTTRQLLENSKKDPTGNTALFYTESEISDRCIEAMMQKD